MADLNRAVLRLRQALQNPRGDARPEARALYEIMVGPVAADLERCGAKTLMGSLDGTLRYVPVAALYDGKQYLVERYRNVVFTPASEVEGFGVLAQRQGAKAMLATLWPRARGC